MSYQLHLYLHSLNSHSIHCQTHYSSKGKRQEIHEEKSMPHAELGSLTVLLMESDH
uniref:Uncharacterized protein n=1 Tax=Rhizophora mucronata TaxID=61149 RepID=A0A2P2LNR3_RHIMU